MKPTIWNIDTTHSDIGFSVRHMVFAKVRGRFGSWRGQVQLDEQDLTGSRVEVEIDASSIDTGVADRDKHLRSADFFDVERFPALRFVSSKVAAAGPDRFEVTGELTIRDVTREIVLEVEYNGRAVDPWGNQRTAFTAKASLDRGEYGLKWNQVLETGGILVGDRIDIDIDVQAVQAASAEAA